MKLLTDAKNIFDAIPNPLANEVFESIVDNGNVKIERIVSKGHASPKTGWYCAILNEWVIVLQGEAVIQFEDTNRVTLRAGSYLNIPAKTKHKVTWTDPDVETIWVAVHY